VTNAREFEKLTETVKGNVQANPKDLEDTKKGKPNISRIKCSRRNKNIYRNFGRKYIEAREPISKAGVDPYWKSLWGKGAQLNG
jgi:hypothetical protein